VNILTNEQIQRTAPSVFATEPYQGTSNRYRFIPTSSIVEALRDRGFFPVRATQSGSRIEGKELFAKHMLRFRQMSNLNQAEGEIPEVVLSAAHDGTAVYWLMLGIFKIVCGNGLVAASSMFNEIRVRHSGSPSLPQEVAEASYDVIRQAPKVIEVMEDWKKIQLTEPQQLAYAESALVLRDSTLKLEPKQMLYTRRQADSNRSLWTTFNKVQENIIRGGHDGVNAKGNRMRQRSIKSVTEDLRINRALWQLTEKMQELVTKN